MSNEVVLSESENQTATSLVDRVESLEDAKAVLRVIATRLEMTAQSSDQLNRALAHFKEFSVNPLVEELRQLRYNMGDRLTRSSQNLEVCVDKLDKVIWAALRAAGMSDAQIRTFRTENGMAPEAPRGDELMAHLQMVDGLKASNIALIDQNQYLLAKLDGRHVFSAQAAHSWVYDPDCQCEVCAAVTRERAQALAEVSRGAGE